MKTSLYPHAARLAALSIVAAAAIAPAVLSAPSTIPSIPVGAMTAYPTVVQTGTKPTLNWNILFPSQVSDMVAVNPPGTLTPNGGDVYVSVQIVGTGVTACDPTQGSSPLYTEVRLSLNGGPYVQLFYGVQTDVSPSHLLYVKKVRNGDAINFAGRYVKNGVWSSLYTSRGSEMRVVSLVNGNLPPTTFPLHQSSRLASYLAPYLDASGRVKIGPLSVLVMMELGQDDRNLECFDYQDQLLLVTFSSKHPNNGHGNNLDGVDVSNPGKGSGGPNGAIDPSGDIDDEKK